MSSITIPCRVRIKEVVSSRYPNHEKPLSWDTRTDGIDTVVIDSGETVNLKSDGGQSPPKEGWVILLSGGDEEGGYVWTLYGIPKGSVLSEIARESI